MDVIAATNGGQAAEQGACRRQKNNKRLKSLSIL
jgi:hypothetical protein